MVAQIKVKNVGEIDLFLYICIQATSLFYGRTIPLKASIRFFLISGVKNPYPCISLKIKELNELQQLPVGGTAHQRDVIPSRIAYLVSSAMLRLPSFDMTFALCASTVLMLTWRNDAISFAFLPSVRS